MVRDFVSSQNQQKAKKMRRGIVRKSNAIVEQTRYRDGRWHHVFFYKKKHVTTRPINGNKVKVHKSGRHIDCLDGQRL
jgi:hypothetical protein